MSGIPYGELQSIGCTAELPDGTEVTVAKLHYAFVIPCMDCRHFYTNSLFNWHECMRDDELYIRPKVEPDGFCAWGERKCPR